MQRVMSWATFGATAYPLLGLILLGISASMFLVVMKLAGEMAQAAEGNEHILTKFIPQAGVGPTSLLVYWFFRLSFPIQEYTFTKVGEYGIADLRRDLFQRIIALDVSFIERNRTGDLISDLQQILSNFSPPFPIHCRSSFCRLFCLSVGSLSFSLRPPSFLYVEYHTHCGFGSDGVSMYVKRFSSKRQER